MQDVAARDSNIGLIREKRDGIYFDSFFRSSLALIERRKLFICVVDGSYAEG